MGIPWLFAGLLILDSIWVTLGRLDLTPEGEEGVSYCIGPGCVSGADTPSGDMVNDEGLTETSNFICPTNDTSFHPDPTDCHRYFICSEGVSSLHTCRAEMGYLPEAEICVSERFVKVCRKVNCDRNGLKRDPIDCTKYYNCFYGHPYHFQCAGGTRFDPVSERCSDDVPCLQPEHNHNHDVQVQFLHL